MTGRNDTPPKTVADVKNDIRSAYESGDIYKTETICRRPDEAKREYADRLLEDKLSTIRHHLRPGPLLDLCCATGEHLFVFADCTDEGIGIDFSRPFIREAREQAARCGRAHLRFTVGDAAALPLPDASVATLYSLSALYFIPDIERTFCEIGRVLRPGGRCILDLGNSRSLNSVCVRAYTELPPTFHITIAEMLRLCEKNRLRVVEHRRFQLLPLWAGKPRWMWPLLHPAWKKPMAARIRGRMLDEWLCSLPLLRNFAFRHLLVCEKIAPSSKNG
ncbi:class I SAM-dependent methyltransferase [Oleispirillum naphthae]|uniref:class I SAM-dependent methyltransferase n=1 Tax=Oleispirillum naphthae TaxID=2838853 RepID=UPI00308236EB